MAKAKRVKRTLYFIAGNVPTEAELAEFEAIGPGAVIRRADLVRTGSCIETCDYVAGSVPQVYADAFPDAPDTVGTTEKPALKPKAEPKPATKAAPVAWTPNT